MIYFDPRSNLKQFHDGVSMGRSFGVHPWMLWGYIYGYWLDQFERAFNANDSCL